MAGLEWIVTVCFVLCLRYFQTLSLITKHTKRWVAQCSVAVSVIVCVCGDLLVRLSLSLSLSL